MNITTNVSSEIGILKKVLIHSPDGGLGNVPTNKLADWLYDDIVDVEKTQEEYSRFLVLLLLFLDNEALFDSKTEEFLINSKTKKSKITSSSSNKFEVNPEKENYFGNRKKLEDLRVLDTQFLLQYLFKKYPEKTQILIENICAVEGLHTYRKNDLKALVREGEKNDFFYTEAVKTLLTGKLEYQIKNSGLVKLAYDEVRYIFPPVPNFIFTRDIGVTIGDHILITKPKFHIRKREVILMRFIAENFLFEEDHLKKVIDVSEDDDFFQIDSDRQEERAVSYEGGDIMMIGKNHLLIGYSERTSPYAIQKLVNRIFWEDTGIEIISVIKIPEKRSQMHIDTVFSQVKEDVWVLHSSLSEKCTKETQKKERYVREYFNELVQKSEPEIKREKDVTIFQFYLNKEGRNIKTTYDKLEKRSDLSIDEKEIEKKRLKGQFKKINYLLRVSKESENRYINNEECPYSTLPEGLEDLLTQISKHEFGKEKVTFIYSGKGEKIHAEREQWTDGCNLLVLRPGVAVGYDRNYKTAQDFNDKLKNEPISDNKAFIEFIVDCNSTRFGSNITDNRLEHIVHVDDLIDFIAENKLSREKTDQLIQSIQNTLLLLPSFELSRARGGSHCMSMPLERGQIN